MVHAEYLRSGRGRSRRAEQAEDRGFMPATRAGKALGVPGRFLAQCALPTEWHHVGSYAQPCDYYDVGAIKAALERAEGQAILAAWRARQRALAAYRAVRHLGGHDGEDRRLYDEACEAMSATREALDALLGDANEIWVSPVEEE